MTDALTLDDHARLSAAIRAAESRTAGEVYVVVARRSDPYFYPAAFVLALGTLVASLFAALVFRWLWIAPSLIFFAAAQVVAFACAVAIIMAAPSLRLLLVPRRLRYRRAHDNALKQFLARNVHRTAGRTGVLIFVSLAERYAEVIADEGIDRHVGPGVWDGMVGGITRAAAAGQLGAGLEAAIAEAGEILARHVPPEANDQNELDDHVVEI